MKRLRRCRSFSPTEYHDHPALSLVQRMGQFRRSAQKPLIYRDFRRRLTSTWVMVS